MTPPSAMVVIGDSLAVGLQLYFANWATEHGLPFRFDAKVGRFTKQQGAELVLPGSIVFVSLGTNDAAMRTDGTPIISFAREVVARKPRAVIWLMPPATKDLPGLDAVRATIASLGMIVVETSAPMRSDGLHPSSYAAVFADILPALDRVR